MGMRKILSCLAMALFLFAFVVVCGCNLSPTVSKPSAELQSSVVDNSMQSVLQRMRISGMEFKILEINKDDLKCVMHPSVKKVIDGVQYDAWPLKIEGTAVIQHSMMRFRPGTYLVNVSYVAYCYVNSVGENKFVIEELRSNRASI